MKKITFIVALTTLIVGVASTAWAGVQEIEPQLIPVVALAIGGALLFIRSRMK